MGCPIPAKGEEMLNHIELLPEQEALFETIVEAARKLRDNHEPFMFIQFIGGQTLQHHGLPGGAISPYRGHLDALANAGLINRRLGSHGAFNFDVTPRGFLYYEHMEQRAGQPNRNVEEAIHRYLDSAIFSVRHNHSNHK
ncbi:MAG TPA: hypothetical protein VKV26_17115 [Dehalococcoidia bacterium]|nr:hypothetical protein [Dehalococcoidia bacterium]